jgi:gluconate 2-dehydrogenase gamma chain
MEDLSTLITRREALRRTALVLGGAVSAPTIAGVLAGCGEAPPPEDGTALRVMTESQREQVATIAEHIIPETDTPGARGVGVDRFIDEMLARYYPEPERELFLAGLESVDERAREAHGEAFLECEPDQQRALLVELDRESFAARGGDSDPGATPDVRELIDGSGSPLPPRVEGDSIRWIHGESRAGRSAERPFFRTMKELTLVGYYTSEAGATMELRHEAVPGRYEGCIPFETVGRTWAV